MVFSIISILFNFVGALTLLLFVMNMLSAEVQKGAGSSFHRFLGIISENRITAVLTVLFLTSFSPWIGKRLSFLYSSVNQKEASL